jgi:hypothetical protein
LAALDGQGYLLVSADEKIGYLATAYTSMRSWYSHSTNTPDAALRRAELARFFQSGTMLPAWRDRKLAVVLERAGGAAIAQDLSASGFVTRVSSGRLILMTRP